jgi:hypothetical protein
MANVCYQVTFGNYQLAVTVKSGTLWAIGILPDGVSGAKSGGMTPYLLNGSLPMIKF